MGNASSAGQQEVPQQLFMKRNESFGSKSPRRINRIQKSSETNHREFQTDEREYCGGGDANLPSRKMAAEERHNGTPKLALQPLQQISSRKSKQNSAVNATTLRQHNRSQSVEQSGMHSPSSSRSSSSNSYINSVLGTTGAIGEAEKSCLRQTTEPMFNISGDLNPHQIGLVRRAWKCTLKAVNNEEMEIAIRILLRIFHLDPRNLSLFSLMDMPIGQLRTHTMFMEIANTFEPTLVHVMSHLTNATILSKHLQQLGGRHVSYTGVTYKCQYWKSLTQALTEVLRENGGDSAELRDALIALGDFCVEQMRIGYRIEYKLQCEAERLAQAQNRRRVFVPHKTP